MKKALRSIVLLLLVFSLLFGVSAPTVLAASSGETAGETLSTDNTGESNKPTENEREVESVETGILDVYFDEALSKLTITLTPDLESAKELDKSVIKEMIKLVYSSVKKSVFDDVRNAIVEGEGNVNSGVTLTGESFWNVAFNNFVTREFPDSETPEIDFINQIIDESLEGSTDLAVRFEQYTCKLVKLSVNLGLLDRSELPTAEKAKKSLEKIYYDVLLIIDYYTDEQKEEFKSHINDDINALVDRYVRDTADLDSNAGNDLNVILEIIEYIDSVKINDVEVFGFVSANQVAIKPEGIKELIADLPRPEQIKDMDPADMRLEYKIVVESEFDTVSEFTVEAVLGGGYSVVKTVASIIADYVTAYIADDGTYVLKLNVPKKFSKLVLEAAQSGAFSDELKQKIFDSFTMTGDDVYALYNNLSVEDIIQLIDAIDFAELLDRDILKKYVDLSNLTDEQIKEKVNQYGKYLNTVKYYANYAVNYIPDRYMDNCIMDFYGDGVFSFNEGVAVDYDTIESGLLKIADKVAPEYKKYVPLLLSYVDLGDEVAVKVDIEVKVEGIYRVDYVKLVDGKEVVIRSGFLPVGADVAFFSGIDNTGILGWVDDEGTKYEKMPAHDVKLHAVYPSEITFVKSDDVDVTYSGEEHDVYVQVLGASENAIITYTWTKDGAPVSVTGNSFKVKNASDSGVYRCLVEVVDGLITASATLEINVDVAKVVIDATSFEWVATVPDKAVNSEGVFVYTYDGNSYGVNFVAKDATSIAALVSFELKNNVEINAGEYTAEIVNADLSLVDTDNYLVDTWSILTLSQPWKITPVEVVISGVEWTITGEQQYTGDFIETVVKSDTIPEGLKIKGYKDNKFATAGHYIAIAEFEPVNGNYVIVGDTTVLNTWSIKEPLPEEPEEIEISDITWILPDSLEYDANEKRVVVDTAKLPDGVTVKEYVVNIDYTNIATNAGTYTAKVVLQHATKTVKIVGDCDTKEWTITPKTISLSGAEWNYSGPVEYSFADQTVTVKLSTLPEVPVIIVDYVNDQTYTNKQTEVGKYTAKAIFSTEDSNYVLTDTESTLDWEIIKIKVNIEDVKWDYDANNPFVYDGTDKTVSLVGYPAEVTVNYDNNVQNEVGPYKATATLVPTDDAHYELVGELNYSLDWEIVKAKINISDIKWDYDANNPFVYDGTDKTVSLVGVPKNVSVNYDENVQNEVGPYKATATLVPADAAHYELVGELNYSLDWEIKKIKITIENIGWDYTDKFAFDGNNKTVALTGVPSNVTVSYTDNVFAKVGSYKATAALAPADAAHYELDGVVAYELDWIIAFDITDIAWGESTEFVYNGSEQKVELVNIPDVLKDYIKVTYTDNAATNHGSYTAGAALEFKFVGDEYSAIEDYPALVIGTAPAENSWKIDKLKVSLSFSSSSYTYKYNEVAVNAIKVLNPSNLDVNITYSTIPTNVGTHTITAKVTTTNDNLEILTPELTTTLVVLVNNVTSHRVQDLIIVNSQVGVPIDQVLVGNSMSHLYDGYDLENDKYAKVLVAYDIYFAKDGNYQYNKDNFEVNLLIPASMRDKTALAVIHITDDGDFEMIDATRDGNYMVFNTEHFSVYAIVEIVDPPAPVEEPEDYCWVWILIVIILLLIIVIIILILIIKRKNKKDDEPEELDVPDEPVEPDDSAVSIEEIASDITDEVIEEEVVEEIVEEPVVIEPDVIVDEPEVELPVEEPVIDEPVIEEPVVEETVVEEPVVEAPIVIEPVEVQIVSSDDDEDGFTAKAIVDGEVVLVRYRSSFQSRLIQSETDVQDYYTVIKNALLSYKGVKARTSWNYESFNKGRVQCAKVNIKGRALLVYLNLAPADFNVNKYHFTDVSDKTKFNKVPMLMKIRSDRALKYTLELIDEMMRMLEIEAIDSANNDYHMPYETTEALAKRGLVKVILPAGMILDENSNIVKVDISEHIENATKGEKSDVKTQEIIINEPVIEEPVVEEPVVEEPVIEEPVIEEPVVEETVIEDPVIEEIAEQIAEAVTSEEPETVEQAQEFVHVDAEHADELLTDEEAEASIEHIHIANSKHVGKMDYINLDTICEFFEDGDVVDIDALKAKRLVSKNTGRIKVLARGVMTKQLTVIAHKFSIQAVKMITLAGGTPEIED